MMGIDGQVKAIGELKTPWPKEHDLEDATEKPSDRKFRHILGMYLC